MPPDVRRGTSSSRLSAHIVTHKARILTDTCAMAGTSETPEGSPASPDDINSRLAEIAAELASEARFKEPSAAERARAQVTAVGPAARPERRGPLRRWRSRRARRTAEELRSPVRPAGAPAPAPPRPPSRMARRAARRQAVPDRGYADATMPSRLRSGTTIVIIMVLLIGVSVGLRYAIRHYIPAAASRGARDTPTAGPTAPPSATPTVATGPQQTFIRAAPFEGSSGRVLRLVVSRNCRAAGHQTGPVLRRPGRRRVRDHAPAADRRIPRSADPG